MAEDAHDCTMILRPEDFCGHVAIGRGKCVFSSLPRLPADFRSELPQRLISHDCNAYVQDLRWQVLGGKLTQADQYLSLATTPQQGAYAIA